MAHRQERPLARVTRVAGTLAVLVTVASLALFLREFPEMVGPAAVGSVGSVLLALVLGLSRGPDRSLTGLGAGLLVTPAAITLAGGVLVAVILLVEDIFPVEEEALLSVGWLVIIGNVGVVVGCVLAVLGLLLLGRNVAAGDGLKQGMHTTVTAGAVPILTTVLFLLVAGATDTTADDALVAPVAGAVGVLVTPVRGAVPAQFEMPVLLVALVAVATLLVGRPGRWQTGTRYTPGPRTAGALAGGTVTTIGVVAGAGWAYERVTTELIRRFPEEIEEQMRDATTTTATSFGESTAVLLAVVLCLGVLAGLLAAVYSVLWAGLLARESVGSSLAGVGLFLAAVFGATVGAPAWLVVGGVSASLLVWDAGRFGVSLAREVGSGRSRRVEFVHLGAALLVGLAAVVVAMLVVARLPTEPNSAAAPDGTELLALASVVVGLLSLVLSLR